MTDTLDPAPEAALDPKAWAEAVKAPYLGVPIWVALADGMMSAPQARVLIAAYLAAASPQAEIDRLRSHLREHWLANIACDHEAKTDTASCSCSMWRDEPHPSVGGAVDAWIEHVIATLHPETLNNGGQND